MKKATKREKRLRRKKRKQALERCIQSTEAVLAGKKREETWEWRAGKARTITLPPPEPGRNLIIKAPPGTPISVEVPGMGKLGPLISGSEPMTEEQFHKMLESLLG